MPQACSLLTEVHLSPLARIPGRGPLYNATRGRHAALIASESTRPQVSLWSTHASLIQSNVQLTPAGAACPAR